MNTSNINLILRKDKYASINFLGTMARDEFLSCLKFTSSGSAIVNTQDSYQAGEHWLYIEVNTDMIDIFDSFGRDPSCFPIIKEGIDSYFSSPITWNNEQLQGITTNVCGDLCVYYCLLRSRGWDRLDIIQTLLKIKNIETRDHAIRRFILSKFGDQSISLSKHRSSGVDGVHVQGVVPFFEQ